MNKSHAVFYSYIIWLSVCQYRKNIWYFALYVLNFKLYFRSLSCLFLIYNISQTHMECSKSYFLGMHGQWYKTDFDVWSILIEVKEIMLSLTSRGTLRKTLTGHHKNCCPHKLLNIGIQQLKGVAQVCVGVFLIKTHPHTSSTLLGLRNSSGGRSIMRQG